MSFTLLDTTILTLAFLLSTFARTGRPYTLRKLLACPLAVLLILLLTGAPTPSQLHHLTCLNATAIVCSFTYAYTQAIGRDLDYHQTIAVFVFHVMFPVLCNTMAWQLVVAAVMYWCWGSGSEYAGWAEGVWMAFVYGVLACLLVEFRLGRGFLEAVWWDILWLFFWIDE